jgi:hypothetical protein
VLFVQSIWLIRLIQSFWSIWSIWSIRTIWSFDHRNCEIGYYYQVWLMMQRSTQLNNYIFGMSRFNNKIFGLCFYVTIRSLIDISVMLLFLIVWSTRSFDHSIVWLTQSFDCLIVRLIIRTLIFIIVVLLMLVVSLLPLVLFLSLFLVSCCCFAYRLIVIYMSCSTWPCYLLQQHLLQNRTW